MFIRTHRRTIAVWVLLVPMLADTTPRWGATQRPSTADSLVHLYQGEDSHTPYLLRAVVRDSSSFAQLWGQIVTRPIPRLDFDRYMVIAATMGLQGSPGNRISIVAVDSSAAILQVKVHLSLSPCPAPGVITYPADVVRVPKSRWTGVTFVDGYTVTRCRD
jgi:hypothetical protein